MTSRHRDPERPYPPGWIERLADWVDRMPGPNSLYYLALLVLELGYLSVLLWLTGRIPVGSVDVPHAFVVVIAPYLLLMRLYLDRVAATALESFRPVLAVGEPEFRRLRYELTTLSARTALVVTAVAGAAFLLNTRMLPREIVEQYGSSHLMAMVVVGPVGFFTYTVIAVSAVQAIQQVRLVARIYDRVGTISLLRARPLYAFSQLTARTGVSFLLLAYYVAAIRPDIVANSPAIKALLLLVIPTSVACFILPLRGMHRRLTVEKERALGEVAHRLEIVFQRLHRRVDEDIVADADKLNGQIASLLAEREALARVSTWPWEPATLTGFLTTLVLPALLWGLQRIVERAGL